MCVLVLERWNVLIEYYVFQGDKKSIESLTELAQRIIKDAMHRINTELDYLVRGLVHIGVLQFILLHHERFCAVMAAAGRDKTRIQNILALRGHELQAFTLTSIRLDKLFEHCRVFLKTGQELNEYLYIYVYFVFVP